MSIRTPEFPTKIACLDDAAFDDGDSLNAHTLRTLGKASNRLLGKGGPIMVLPFNFSVVGTPYGHNSFALQEWTPILPIDMPVNKMPGTNTYEISIVANILKTDDDVFIQVVTNAAPFNEHATDGDLNCARLTSTVGGTWYATDFTAPSDVGPTDNISIFMRGNPSSRLMDTATYGAPNTGTIGVGVSSPSSFVDPGAAWNTTGNTPAKGGHYVQFTTSVGNHLIGQRHAIVDGGPTSLVFYPELLVDEFKNIIGSTYQIAELPVLRISGISIYAADRTA